MRHLRLLGAIAGLALLASACTAGAVPTTTTTIAPQVTTTTTPGGRITLTANGPTFIVEGTKDDPYVEALQFYLVCSGFEQPSADQGAVTVRRQQAPSRSHPARCQDALKEQHSEEEGLQ